MLPKVTKKLLIVLEVMAVEVGGPPGLDGGVRGVGEVGHARQNYDYIVKGMTRLKDIEENTEHEAVNPERHIEELSKLSRCFGPPGP